jgi:hypothetical protein
MDKVAVNRKRKGPDQVLVKGKLRKLRHEKKRRKTASGIFATPNPRRRGI